MSKRIDGYLTRLAQEAWSGALIHCETGSDASGEWEDWWIERPGVEDLGLGCKFPEAKLALQGLLKAERARKERG